MDRDSFDAATKLKQGFTFSVGDIVIVDGIYPHPTTGKLFDNKAYISSFKKEGVSILPLEHNENSNDHFRLISYEDALNFIFIISTATPIE